MKVQRRKKFFRLPKDPLEDLITHDPTMDCVRHGADLVHYGNLSTLTCTNSQRGLAGATPSAWREAREWRESSVFAVTREDPSVVPPAEYLREKVSGIHNDALDFSWDGISPSESDSGYITLRWIGVDISERIIFAWFPFNVLFVKLLRRTFDKEENFRCSFSIIE